MDFLGSLRRLSSRFICQKILITTVASERMLASGREMLVANWWEGNVIQLISYSLSALLQKVCFLGPVSEVQPFLVFLFATWYRVTLHICNVPVCIQLPVTDCQENSESNESGGKIYVSINHDCGK